MMCPFCHNEIKEIEQCPRCKTDLIFKSGEGPYGTFECEKCSTDKQIVGYRRSIIGLIRVYDFAGRYSYKK